MNQRLAVAPVRAVIGAVVVIGLAVVGVAWSTPSWSALTTAADRFAQVPWPWLLAAGAAAFLPVAAEALRVRAAGRMIGVAIAPTTAVDAACANSFFTAITPVTGLGEPAVAWVLARSGVAPDAALVVPFVKFATSFALVFACGSLAFALGWGPPGHGVDLGGAIVMAFVASAMIAVLVGARRPARAIATVRSMVSYLSRRRWAGARVNDWLARVANSLISAIERLSQVRVRAAGWLLVSHAVYFAAYVAPLVIACEALAPGTAARAAPRALTYLCVTWLAPTPGGAGVAEGSAAWFFGDLIGPADAVIVVIGFRIARFATHVVGAGGYVGARRLWRIASDPPNPARDH